SMCCRCGRTHVTACAAAGPAVRKTTRRNGGEKYGQGLSDPRPHLQRRGGDVGLEKEPRRRLCTPEDLPDLQMVGRSRTEEEGRRPAGARGLLHHHARADESEFQLLSRGPHTLSTSLLSHTGLTLLSY